MTESPFPRPHRIIIGFLILLLLILSFIVYDIVICIIFPIFVFDKRVAYDISSRMAEWIWGPLQYLFIGFRGAQVTFTGDYHEIPNGENALVICNHRSWTDWCVIHALAQKKRMLSRCRYFVKHSLTYIPFFGWALVLAGMVVVRRNWITDRKKLQETFAAMKERQWPIWLIMFAEGTRLRPDALAQVYHSLKYLIVKSQDYSRKRGKPIFKNVLVPRPNGFCACISALREGHIHHVYDLTLSYHPTKLDPPTLFQIFCLDKISPPYSFHIHIRRYNMDELPRETDQLKQWLMDRWQEKDVLLENSKDD